MNGRRVPVTVAVVTLLAGAAVLLDAPALLRLPLVTAFLLVCPGLAWVPHPRDGSSGDTIALATAVSIAAAALVAETMALTATWNPLAAFAVLAGLTFVGVALRLRAIRRVVVGPRPVPVPVPELDAVSEPDAVPEPEPDAGPDVARVLEPAVETEPDETAAVVETAPEETEPDGTEPVGTEPVGTEPDETAAVVETAPEETEPVGETAVEPDEPETPEPEAEEPEAATAEPEAATAEPEAPTAEPEAPTAEPEAPTEEPEAPTEEPEAPTEEAEAQEGDPGTPAEERPPAADGTDPVSAERSPDHGDRIERPGEGSAERSGAPAGIPPGRP